MRPKNRPAPVVRITAVVLLIVLSLACAEAFATAFYFLRDGKWVSVRDRLNSGNAFVAQITDARDCRYIDSLFPSPYLAHVHHRNPPCTRMWINNIGLFGRDVPMDHDPSRFTILLTGGSVAAQLGQITKGGPLFLEEELNRCYFPPQGQTFLVLNGADGAWKQPQQAILLLLYGDVVDAVVTLDGFNEHYALQSKARLEVPSPNFATINPIATGYRPLAAAYLTNELVSYAADHWLLSRSFFTYLFIDWARRLFERDAMATVESARPTTVSGMFALPPDWPVARRQAFNLAQYRKYVRSMTALAESRKILSSFFIQPVPAFGKTLTPDERNVVGDLGYRDVYLQMTVALLDLRERGIAIFSLLDAFNDVGETIYQDQIHFRYDKAGDSLGYRIVASKMARSMAAAWKLERRPSGCDAG